MTKTGTLYGIGVGPGDPELLTLKAARIVSRVDAVLAASSTKNDYSLALDAARPHLAPGVEVVRLGFPMTRDQAVLDRAWEENAHAALAVLDAGRDAAFLTLGDPMTYSTFAYLLRTVRAMRPELPVEVVPGITSYQAAAAKAQVPLVESGQSLAVVSGIADGESLARVLSAVDNAVILKAYRNFPIIRQTLEDLGLAKTSLFATSLGMEGECILTGLADAPRTPPYFSLVLARR